MTGIGKQARTEREHILEMMRTLDDLLWYTNKPLTDGARNNDWFLCAALNNAESVMAKMKSRYPELAAKLSTPAKKAVT